MSASAVSFAWAALLLAALTLQLWLTGRQIRHVAAHRDTVPAAFAGTVTLEAHRKAAAYTIARNRLALVQAGVAAAVALGWTLLGGLDTLNRAVAASTAAAWGPLGYQLALLVAVSLVGGLIDLPLSWYETFRLEQRFGFNRMTPRLWAGDLLRQTLLSAVLGLPLAALVLWIMSAAGAGWWIWAWCAWAAFVLAVQAIFPTFIAPLFNRFEPLQDEGLKARVSALMQRCGFRSRGFFVMDGSRRSAHANAYFTGIGSSRRVVFYDTLLQRLGHGEVEAVLAHELGHFRHRHVPMRLATLLATSAAALALLGWLSSQAAFYTGLGVQPLLGLPNDALALLLFTMVLPHASLFVSPLLAQLSRRHEFQADAYACTQSSPADLRSALLKLYEDNASTLTPDPLYVRFHYSHPPASERLAALPR
jgi:STE24 endopeptidase